MLRIYWVLRYQIYLLDIFFCAITILISCPIFIILTVFFLLIVYRARERKKGDEKKEGGRGRGNYSFPTDLSLSWLSFLPHRSLNVAFSERLFCSFSLKELPCSSLSQNPTIVCPTDVVVLFCLLACCWVLPQKGKLHEGRIICVFFKDTWMNLMNIVLSERNQ